MDKKWRKIGTNLDFYRNITSITFSINYNMELRMAIEDDLMDELKNALDVKRGVDVVDNALTLLDWAVKEVQQGRVILSATKEGKNIQTLIMPSLENARRNAKTKEKTS